MRTRTCDCIVSAAHVWRALGSHREVAKPALLPSALEITPCHAGGTHDESESFQLDVQSTLLYPLSLSPLTVNQRLQPDEADHGRLHQMQTAMRDEKHASPCVNSVLCSTHVLTAVATSGATDEAEIQGKQWELR